MLEGLPGGPVVKTSPSIAGGLWVRSLVGELKFHMRSLNSTCSWPKNQNMKHKKNGNNFNKTFKSGPRFKKNDIGYKAL